MSSQYGPGVECRKNIVNCKITTLLALIISFKICFRFALGFIAITHRSLGGLVIFVK